MQKAYIVTTIEGDTKEIPFDIAERSKYIKDNAKDNKIKLEMKAKILELVIKYLNISVDIENKLQIPEPLPEKDLKEIVTPPFYEIIDQDFETVFELINAGALLEIEKLHDAACAKIAHFMKGKTPEEVSKQFTIECQLTNEEAKELGLDVEENEEK